LPLVIATGADAPLTVLTGFVVLSDVLDLLFTQLVWAPAFLTP
jgi:hypothetical protein